VLCGINNIPLQNILEYSHTIFIWKYSKILRIIMSAPQNVVMDKNNVMPLNFQHLQSLFQWVLVVKETTLLMYIGLLKSYFSSNS
jgi:hypothetical protein